jgi:hypothetical protein
MTNSLVKFGMFLSVFLCLSSCGKKSTETGALTPDEIELKGSMIGGIYAMTGYGGVTEVEKMVNGAGQEPEDLVQSYRELFIFPFKPEEGESTKKTLKDYWDIDSKASLIETLDDLKKNKDPKNPHKAWDYSRIVNNVWMGYSASYLTKEEANKYISETLVLAQKEFKTWDDFLKDYNEGRITWNPESEDKETFTKASEEMLKNEIYKLIPLN